MSRWMVFLIFIFSQIYNSLVCLKNETVTAFLYFIVLGPVGLMRKLTWFRKDRLLIRRSSWVNIEEGGMSKSKQP